jgi:2-(1,2-epoxy-1,2-dihydrophenyl)acetyl-CoA isomerase
MAEQILVEQTDDVVTLRLNNPAAMNAMDGDMAEDLSAKLAVAAGHARAIVLAGTPRAFCAGANLQNPDMARGAADFDAGHRLETSFNPLMTAIKTCPVPIISAVSGAAAGVGASIALACDMIVAGKSAYFLQAFRRIGLVPDGGSALLLAQAVGRVRAMELMLLGERLPAETALAWGLINRLVEDSDVESTAASLAANLAAGPTRALGMIRQVAWSALAGDWETQLGMERELQRDAGRTKDFAEGVAAFLGKRAAVFTGK